MLCALLIPALRIGAQSGRNKPQQPPTRQQPRSPAPTAPKTRPRSVNTTSTQPREQSPDGPLSEPPPNSPVDVGDAPPLPSPKSTPVPARPAANRTDDEIDAADVVRINSNLVTVPASVLDAQGKAVTNLKLEDFELRVDGQPRPITDLGFADSPVRMALLFDNSSSLVSAREFEKQAAVRFFRSVLRPTDQAMIYSVSTVPTLEQPLTNDVQTLVRTIERFPKPEGATALFDAINQAATYLKPHQEGRRVIVIVSDGADTISDLDFESTLRRAQAADCQIYAVQTGHIENANLRDLAAERRLQEFTSQTGGAVYVPHGTSDLDSAFAQIAADLSQQYVLSYYPEDEQRDGRFRTISVRVTTRPNLRVRARKGYYPMPGQKQAGLPNITTTPEGQNQLVARNASAVNLDQPSTGPNGSAGVESQPTDNATVSTPLYLKMNTGANARDRVGPRGPSDDPGGADDAQKQEPEPEIVASTQSPPSPSQSPAPTASPTPTPSPSPTSTSAPTPTPTPAPAHAPTPGSTPDAPSSRTSDTTTRSKRSETSTAKTSTANGPASSPGPTPSEERSEPKAPASGGVLNGKAIALPKPFYPSAARSIGAGGTVVIEVTVDENGKVISARAVSGHPLLLASCLAAAKLARFSPTILSGKPVKVLGTISYNFAQK